MIYELRYIIEEDGTKTLEGYDGHNWYKISDYQWYERRGKASQ